MRTEHQTIILKCIVDIIKTEHKNGVTIIPMRFNVKKISRIIKGFIIEDVKKNNLEQLDKDLDGYVNNKILEMLKIETYPLDKKHKEIKNE
jgi:hypothetical protein